MTSQTVAPAKTTDERIAEEMTPPEILASRLIDAWCVANNRQIPWAKAVEISAIVTKMSDEEKQRLLAL